MNEELKTKADNAVRIVTWNVHRGLHKKLRRVRDELQADVAVLPEVANEGRLRREGVNEFRTMDWVGRLQDRGLAVMGFGNWRTALHEKAWDPRLEFVLPAKAKGPQKSNFNVFGCWVKKKAKFDPNPDLGISQGAHIPLIYPQLLTQPSVIAGDFNNNLSWDKPGKRKNWQLTLDAMDGIGLRSAYHDFFDEEQGNETRPTFRSNSSGKTFHIDHCFVPKDWTITQVWVGGPEDWLRKGDGSDHAPMVVDVVPQASDRS